MKKTVVSGKRGKMLPFPFPSCTNYHQPSSCKSFLPMNFLFLLPVFFVLFSANSINFALATDRQNKPNPQHLDGIFPKEYDKLRVTPENSERLRTMHVNLYMGALKALIGQLGKKLYQQLNNGKTYVFLNFLKKDYGVQVQI